MAPTISVRYSANARPKIREIFSCELKNELVNHSFVVYFAVFFAAYFKVYFVANFALFFDVYCILCTFNKYSMKF